jgi:hypothetical protein
MQRQAHDLFWTAGRIAMEYILYVEVHETRRFDQQAMWQTSGTSTFAKLDSVSTG